MVLSRLATRVVRLLLVLVLVALAEPSAWAQSREIVVAPRTGATILRGALKGDSDVTYRIDLAVGDRLALTLKPTNRATYMNVSAPGAQEAMHIGSTAGNSFSTTATVAGPHAVQVYLMRSAARRGERTAFTLTLKVTKAGATSPDFADGLSGGPDYWRVAGVAARDRLNLRRTPSARAGVTARVANGASLRNLGCRMEGQQRWCRVETQGAVQGWALGRFLREGAPPSASRPGDALVPGTNYHATGQVACALKAAPQHLRCDFGVTRGGAGVATVFITRADGTKRVLGFDKGAVRSLQAADAVRMIRAGDSFLVDIDRGAEVYTIPDAVIDGG